MKKWLLILGMITCMAGLTACGGKEAVEGFKTVTYTHLTLPTNSRV